ncbi:pali-domain-containing protein, partial [Dissoconium aciculare CBS 342.82]|uniref:Pali-domain-containing protein n=1 Tax=Dissoconium aciculare CBS 342.82 TaxID=1314786 RepID=A0A6J3LV26_9PEZI
MLRPATPLSIIFLIAFVLALLTTLSTPIIKQIPLGSYEGYNFGVFGWCNQTTCSKFGIGYHTDILFQQNGEQDPFTLPETTRYGISGILIVHPIAALLILICFGLAVAAHFHGPSHSPRYLLGLLILTIPTLIVTLLAFLVDILLFVPHLNWGGWIELAATILIIGSTIVTCAMRRTVVSRKARKKRIEENADMNGSAYYESLAADQRSRVATAPSVA